MDIVCLSPRLSFTYSRKALLEQEVYSGNEIGYLLFSLSSIFTFSGVPKIKTLAKHSLWLCSAAYKRELQGFVILEHDLKGLICEGKNGNLAAEHAHKHVNLFFIPAVPDMQA